MSAYQSQSCILSKFYIKPQLRLGCVQCLDVVSYRNSTSNHNPIPANQTSKKLYLIEILHQTTTQDQKGRNGGRCILSKFYIKPQLSVASPSAPSRCILSKFYIKPQLAIHTAADLFVVSYRNSTSNHNCIAPPKRQCKVVSYRNSTSNHNIACEFNTANRVVSYRNSTSNHNISFGCFFANTVVSYRNSTSNHNQ